MKETDTILTELKIHLTTTERIVLKRIDEKTVMVSVEEDLSGITRKLAFYDLVKRKWEGYNPHNFSLWFDICKQNKQIAPKIIRFITTSDIPEEVKQMRRTFTCFKRRVNITVNKVVQKTKHDLEEIKDMILEPFH